MGGFWVGHPIALMILAALVAGCFGAAAQGPYRAWPKRGQWPVRQMFEPQRSPLAVRGQLVCLLLGLVIIGVIVLLEAML